MKRVIDRFFAKMFEYLDDEVRDEKYEVGDAAGVVFDLGKRLSRQEEDILRMMHRIGLYTRGAGNTKLVIPIPGGDINNNEKEELIENELFKLRHVCPRASVQRFGDVVMIDLGKRLTEEEEDLLRIMHRISLIPGRNGHTKLVMLSPGGGPSDNEELQLIENELFKLRFVCPHARFLRFI